MNKKTNITYMLRALIKALNYCMIEILQNRAKPFLADWIPLVFELKGIQKDL